MHFTEYNEYHRLPILKRFVCQMQDNPPPHHRSLPPTRQFELHLTQNACVCVLCPPLHYSTTNIKPRISIDRRTDRQIVCRKPEICISNRIEMAKKKKSLLVLGKAKMNDALNGNIFIDRIASSYLPFPISFFQYCCLFHNAEAQKQELSC